MENLYGRVVIQRGCWAAAAVHKAAVITAGSWRLDSLHTETGGCFLYSTQTEGGNFQESSSKKNFKDLKVFMFTMYD